MISSVSHPRIKELRRLLGRRSSRLSAGAFVVEGPVLVAEAIAAGLELRVVLGSGEALAELDVLAEPSGRHLGDAAVVACAPNLLERVLSTVSPQPLAAIVSLPAHDVGSLRAERGGVVLVLAGISDPGNAGTLVRSAEASGAVGVACSAGSVDPFNPKVVRAAAGSLFRLPVVASPLDDVALVESLAPRRTVVSVPTGGVPHAAVDWTGPIALVVGAEAQGASAALLDAADELCTIRMAGRVESLNAAMAGTVLLFEAARHRVMTTT